MAIIVAIGLGVRGYSRPYGYSDFVYKLADGKWHMQGSSGGFHADGEPWSVVTWKRFELAPPPMGLLEVDSMDLPFGEEPPLRDAGGNLG